MKRLLLAVAAVAITKNAASPGSNSTGRFDSKLSPEQKIQQAISRLTFGARPGDFEGVRKLGVEKWIEMQLHPERITEATDLEVKLKPLATIRMETADLLKEYFPQFPPGFLPPVRLNELLPGDQFRKVFNGTAEERRAVIIALDSDKRTKVLAALPPNLLESLPDLQKEQTAARKKQQENQQAEMRRLRPPLMELLDPQQVPIALRGTSAQRAALFSSLDPAKLRQ